MMFIHVEWFLFAAPSLLFGLKVSKANAFQLTLGPHSESTTTARLFSRITITTNFESLVTSTVPA